MSVVLLTSAGRSCGTTTTALGLALTWPGQVLLVDADRNPSQAVLAGYLQGVDPQGSGLWQILSAHRERRPLRDVIGPAGFPLSQEADFLPGFAQPGMVDLFGAVWAPFGMALAEIEGDVIIDAGRIGSDGLPAGLLQAADLTLVLTGSTLVDLVGLRLFLPLVTAAAEAEVELVAVGPGRPYSTTEISAQFGLPCEGRLPWSPRRARVWSDGEPPRSGFQRSRYHRGIAGLARELAARVAARQHLIGVPG